MEKEHQVVPIWFFHWFAADRLRDHHSSVAASTHWCIPAERTVVLANLHADVWWGALMLVLGLFYTIKFRPSAAAASK